jgi:hypothetical protein
MTERELQDAIVSCARLFHWRVHHARAAMSRRGWRTPLTGHVGFPDLVLAGHGRVLFIELKVARRALTVEQEAWLEALRAAGQELYVWRDTDWVAGTVERVLRGRGEAPAA